MRATVMAGVVFDCDGVLVDSELLSCGAWLPVLARQGIGAELAEIEQFIGRSDREVLEHFRSKTGLPLAEELITERLQEYSGSGAWPWRWPRLVATTRSAST
jgi:beta-phosphoglucomutase-like phosphatase (HAD superfamily)